MRVRVLRSTETPVLSRVRVEGADEFDSDRVRMVLSVLPKSPVRFRSVEVSVPMLDSGVRFISFLGGSAISRVRVLERSTLVSLLSRERVASMSNSRVRALPLFRKTSSRSRVLVARSKSNELRCMSA